MGVTWLDPPVDKSPGAVTGWNDIDCSAQIPAGATGVLLYVRNTSTTVEELWGARKNGSTDARTNKGGKNGQWGVAIGVDANRIFEVYQNTASNYEIYLLGYFGNDAVFKTNGVQKNGTINTWVDRDISGDTGGDTAIGAILEFNSGGNVDMGLRKNGSTDARTAKSYHASYIIGVDGSEIFEAWVDTDSLLFLVGYITKEANFNTNALDRSLGSTGSWIDLTALPAGATGGIYEVQQSGGGQQTHGLREDGTTGEVDGLHLINKDKAHRFARASASQLVEGRIGATALDFFEIGDFQPGAAGGGPSLAPGIMASL